MTDVLGNLKTGRAARRALARHCLDACLLVVAFSIVSGCTSPDVRIPVAVPESFPISGKAPLAERWWESLEDDDLNALVEEALKGNFTLKAAWDRLDQARATSRKESASLWPSLEGSAGLSRTVRRTAPAAGGHGKRAYQTEYSLGLSASYEVDLWGRVQAAQDAAVLSAKATEEDLRAAALSLSGRIASTWYSLIEQRAQRDLLARQIETNARYLQLLELRFRKGRVSATTVLQQRRLLEASRTDTAQVKANIETLEHQLAMLIGQAPGQVELPSGGVLPTLPPLPNTGVPADWMRARPDICAAFLRVRSSDKDVAAAIAERFPRIAITGGVSTAASKPSLLFEEWLMSLAGSLTAPIFDAGQRAAEANRARAAATESLHHYAQAILTGLQEVEDALSTERFQRDTVRGLETQLELSNKTLLQLTQKFKNGTVDFLRVLDERRTQQALQRSLLGAQAQLLQDRVTLCLALGGTWELDRPDEDTHAGHDRADDEKLPNGETEI